MCPPQLTVKVEVPGTFTWDPNSHPIAPEDPQTVPKAAADTSPLQTTKEREMEAALAIAQFHFEHYRRRAEGEHKYRLAFWGAIIASMFLPIKNSTPLSVWVIAISAIALWFLYMYWMYFIYAANSIDQNKYRYYIGIVEKQLPTSEFQTQNPINLTNGFFNTVLTNRSFRLQVVITGFLLLISAFWLNRRTNSPTAKTTVEVCVKAT